MQENAAVPVSSNFSDAAQQDRQAPGGCGSEQCGEQGCGSKGGAVPGGPGADTAQLAGKTCMKCRKAEAELVARGREPLCYPCLHEQLLSKVRNAVRLHALIQPGDRLALAFSGGRGSAALLHFLSQLRNPRTDRPARGKVSFTMHIIHIDESAAAQAPQGSDQQSNTAASVAAAAQPYCGEGVQYHCVPLESVFGLDSGAAAVVDGNAGSGAAAGTSLPRQADEQRQQQQRERLQALLSAVGDATGREDSVRHLRTHLLLRTAAALGCAKLARGDCATSLATHIVAAASKGCGYSLPGDVRLVDARHGGALPAVFLPLREVSSRELALLCAHWRLPLARPSKVDGAGGAANEAAQRARKKSINWLAAAFIEGMEAHNPGSVPNILNTISKLEAFPWNESDPTQGSHPAPGRQQQQQQRQQQAGEQRTKAAALLCPICLAPLADDELPGGSGGCDSSEHTSGGSGTAAAAAAAGCCLSCYRQILGGGSAAAADAAASSVAGALPEQVQQQMAALAAAGSRAAKSAATAENDSSLAGGGSGVENLRAAIAEFLLE